jgi:hypothetical protein
MGFRSLRPTILKRPGGPPGMRHMRTGAARGARGAGVPG